MIDIKCPGTPETRNRDIFMGKSLSGRQHIRGKIEIA